MKSLIFPNVRLLTRLLSINSARKLHYVGLFSRSLHCHVVPRAKRQLVTSCRFLTSTTVDNSTDKPISFSDDHFISALKCNDVNKTLELFDVAKKDGIVPQAKMFSQALHLLLLNNQHEEIDKLYKDMCNYGYHTGEGVRMTLIRSYVTRRMWNDAIAVLDGIEKGNLMRHTRSYNPIIKGLAGNGLGYEAFQLFEKKLKMSHCISSGNESITRDTEMFVAMIKSCCMIDSSQTPTSEDINNQSSTKRPGLTEGNKDLNMKSTVGKHSLTYRLFQFFYESGIKFPTEILQACKDWSAHDESHIWTWNIFCTVNQTGKCNLCGTTVCEDLPDDYFKDLENELIRLLSGGNGKLTHDEVQELNYVSALCKENGPFDVIIDAQNLGLEGRRKGDSSPYLTKMYEKRIVEVVEHFSKQKKTIFLPLHNKAMENDISGKFLEFLRNHCEVQILKTYINEDFLLLYAAALSGLDHQRTCIVTNDNWRDHSAMLSENNHWKLLKWARINHVTFTVTHKNMLKFHKNLFDPVIMKTDSSWHFPLDNGNWQCARLKKR